MKTFDIKKWSPKKRAVLIVLALLLILCIITSATYAWLRDNSGILTNTFTGSNLTIDLSETTSDYKMVPNTPVAKDPTVTVEATSEPAYVFLKAIESDAFSNYADYYIDNTWQPYGGFVVDGELDSFYRDDLSGWYFNSTNASYGLEAYYSSSDKHNGDATAFYNNNGGYAQTYQPLAEAINDEDENRCQIALEMWVAYDPNYVYVYAKVFDNDYHQVANFDTDNHSDYFGIYYDPDPLSYTNMDTDDYKAHSGTFYPENNSGQLVSDPSSLTYQKDIATHGEMEIKFFPAEKTDTPDFAELSAIPNNKKIGYGNGSTTDFYNNVEKYFINQGVHATAQGKNYVMVDMYADMDGNPVVKEGQNIKTGYIVETRLPRNDNYFTNPNGNPVFALNVAATNFASDYNNDQMSLSFSKLWWLNYENMVTFELDDKNSPFAAANTGVYYKTVGNVEDGPLANDVTIPVLRSGYVFGEEYNNGYVWVRDNVTTEMLNNLTNTPVTLEFKACAIQRAHLTLEQAYQEAIGNLS